MELKELALRTREEIEQEISRIYPKPENPANSDEIDQVMEKRVELRKNIARLQVEALLDGKLTINQVVAQLHSEEDNDVDSIHRKVLTDALEELKSGGNRVNIIGKTVENLKLL